MQNKKLDVHLVEHTHWDREWYFTSDDSRSMLYYNMRFMISYLEKNNDKFTYDGQSSVIDDFLKYSPTWKDKMAKVVKDKKLYVGPFYTAVDNTVAAGESITRNLEMGQYIATTMGHSMEVGYLPDTFGHNNQIPQILRMNGLNNLSFYRGLDPEKINDKLYFKYVGQDGSEVLGHWQTHYTTRGFGPRIKQNQYTAAWFAKNIIADYQTKGEFGPSVKSYEKRNLGLPIAIPIGTDQRPFSKKMPSLIAKMNKKYPKYNFINSSYEDFIQDVMKQIKTNQIPLLTINTELRVAKTGRVHRTVASSRMDIKQLHYELEQVLINILEPMAIMCDMNNIDVPWKMIEECWKSLHKSSAHDSYACSNEDLVNRKLKSRLWNAIRTSRNIIAMLSRIYARQLISEKDDKYKKLLVFNYKHSLYQGIYQIMTTVKEEFENGKFKIFDQGKEITYSILNHDHLGTHEKDAMTLLLHNVKINAFAHKILDIKYEEKNNYKSKANQNCIKWGALEITINKDAILIKKDNKIYNNLIRLAFDPSVGDTYDYSPITHHDKKYFLTNFQVLETVEQMHTIRFKGQVNLPQGIKEWTKNKVSIVQDAIIQLTIIDKKIHVHLHVQNKVDNARMILMIKTFDDAEHWYHDQQFGIYKRTLKNKYMDNWNKEDALGYKWGEYPTNLAPFQSFITNNKLDLTIYAYGTKEHEMINYKGEKNFAITLYRTCDKFGTTNLLYRPGRASGAKCDAPDAQLKGNNLFYSFLIDFAKTPISKKFSIAENMHLKNFYIPQQWALHRTILRWNTEIAYYDNDKKHRGYNLIIPKMLRDASIRTSSFYKRMNGDVVLRLLNTGPNKIIKTEGFKMARDLEHWSTNDVVLPKFGLINILMEKK